MSSSLAFPSVDRYLRPAGVGNISVLSGGIDVIEVDIAVGLGKDVSKVRWGFFNEKVAPQTLPVGRFVRCPTYV